MNRPSVRRALLSIAAWVVVGAIGCGPASEGEANLDGDGGERTGEFVQPDAGDPGIDDACAAMLDRVCGPGGTTCLDNGGCQAALLIARYERHRCSAALEDSFVYPTCEADACARLLDKVCGEGDTCAEASPCQQAKGFAAQLNDPGQDDVDREAAREACGAALVDEIVFAPCD